MVNYRTPTSDSASDNFYSDNEDMSDPANIATNDNLPPWLQSFLQVQQDTVNTQQQQMLQLIQQQGQRLDHMASLFTQGQSLNQSQAPDPAQADRADVKRPRPKLPDPDKFTAEDLSLFPQFLGKLQAKLEIDAAAIGAGRDHVWYCFSRLDGKAAARIYPWISAYKDSVHEFTVERFFAQLAVAFEDPARKDKALNRLNTLRQGNRSFGELMSELDRLLLEAGGHGWADEVKKGYVRAAINQALRDRLITIEEKPTYEEYCLQIKNIADRLAEFKRIASTPEIHSRGGLGHPTSGTNGARPGNTPTAEPMEWEPSTAKSSKRARWVDKEELNNRRQNGSCMRCGSSKHFIKDCPFLPPKRPTRMANSTQGLEVSEVDVPDALLDDECEENSGGKYTSGKALPHTYGLVSARFVQRHQLKRIKIRSQSIRGFSGPIADKIEEVAKFSLDIGGNYQSYVYLYVVPKIDGHDVILGTPWMRHQNAVPLPDRSKLVFRNSGIAISCGLGLAKMSDVLDAMPISAAGFNFWRTRLAKRKDPNIQIFAASLRDIERTLRPKEHTDPRTKLPRHYHDYLDVFDRKSSETLPPLRGPGVDHKIELIEKDENGKRVEPPWGPLYNMGRVHPRQ
ncbi:hypothetical protein V1517DRAFT_373280 [Lipomyces orientalis]|uniref:Uncharacterized protein n=1 Tax=Lipomyces orientalis TaxID=1233043 RepID=A0ACC3TSJ6_9ASCO